MTLLRRFLTCQASWAASQKPLRNLSPGLGRMKWIHSAYSFTPNNPYVSHCICTATTMPTLQEVISKQTVAELRNWLKVYDPAVLPKTGTSKAEVVKVVLGNPDAIPATVCMKASTTYKCGTGSASSSKVKKDYDRLIRSLASKQELFKSPVLARGLKAMLQQSHGVKDGKNIYRAAKEKMKKLEKDGVKLLGSSEAPILIDESDDGETSEVVTHSLQGTSTSYNTCPPKSKRATTVIPATSGLPTRPSTSPVAEVTAPPPAEAGRPSWRTAAQ